MREQAGQSSCVFPINSQLLCVLTGLTYIMERNTRMLITIILWKISYEKCLLSVLFGHQDTIIHLTSL